MKNNENRKYLGTFILDTRGYDEPVETLIDKLKNIITDIKGTVGEVENLGPQDFARVTNKHNPTGHYVRITFEGNTESAATIKEKLRLDKTVNRVLIESC